MSFVPATARPETVAAVAAEAGRLILNAGVTMTSIEQPGCQEDWPTRSTTCPAAADCSTTAATRGM